MLILNDIQEIFPHSVDGVIDQCENNQLRVKAFGSIWNAKLHAKCHHMNLICGQSVAVVGRIGIRLIITTQHCKI